MMRSPACGWYALSSKAVWLLLLCARNMCTAQDMAKMPDHMQPDAPLSRRASFYAKGQASGPIVMSDASLAMTLHANLAPLDCCQNAFGSDIWGYTSARSGREYALMTYRTGLAVVNS